MYHGKGFTKEDVDNMTIDELLRYARRLADQKKAEQEAYDEAVRKAKRKSKQRSRR